LCLFIDFRKAFDLVDSKLLLNKLFHYGFDNNALELIKNYFDQRSQLVKFGDCKSSTLPIELGVPQGSVLGPLFFLLFINDLPLFLNDMSCKMFADDTSLYMSSSSLDKLLQKFNYQIKRLLDWCRYNRLDINWSKTYFMLITNKRTVLPKHLMVNKYKVEVVSSFRLLGVIIDNKLNFIEYARYIKTIVNRKLFSIKKLFYLATSVKLQFFKSFILPYFDYCLSIYIYFPKITIQKIANCYNSCMFKLFKFKAQITTPQCFNTFNNFLEKI